MMMEDGIKAKCPHLSRQCCDQLGRPIPVGCVHAHNCVGGQLPGARGAPRIARVRQYDRCCTEIGQQLADHQSLGSGIGEAHRITER